MKCLTYCSHDYLNDTNSLEKMKTKLTLEWFKLRLGLGEGELEFVEVGVLDNVSMLMSSFGGEDASNCAPTNIFNQILLFKKEFGYQATRQDPKFDSILKTLNNNALSPTIQWIWGLSSHNCIHNSWIISLLCFLKVFFFSIVKM